jgi:hypothetical protein
MARTTTAPRSNKPDLSGYVEVKDRVEQFYRDYPDGRLVTEYLGMEDGPDGRRYVIVRALAYRTQDDPHPATGLAWEPVPGLTPYTKNSELQNAETSAIGRAIVFVNERYTAYGIASANEVRNRRDERSIDEMKTELRAMLEDAGVHSSYLRMTQREVEEALSGGRRPVELFLEAQERQHQAEAAAA